MKLSRNSRQGFTLMELLVVAVVTVVVVALILPALSSAHEKARRTSCHGDLGKIGIACAVYAGDNANRLPCGTSSVFLNLALATNYLGSVKVLVCPSSMKKPAASFSDPHATDAANISYIQQVPPLNSKSIGMRMCNLNEGADVVFWDQGVAGNACGPDGGVGLSWAKTSNHKDAGGNVLFNDGHVAWCSQTPTNMTLGCLNP